MYMYRFGLYTKLSHKIRLGDGYDRWTNNGWTDNFVWINAFQELKKARLVSDPSSL